jgi:hypothetical protein
MWNWESKISWQDSIVTRHKCCWGNLPTICRYRSRISRPRAKTIPIPKKNPIAAYIWHPRSPYSHLNNFTVNDLCCSGFWLSRISRLFANTTQLPRRIQTNHAHLTTHPHTAVLKILKGQVILWWIFLRLLAITSQFSFTEAVLYTCNKKL